MSVQRFVNGPARSKKDVNFKSIAVTSVRFGHQSLALRRSRNARCFSAGVIAFPFAAGRPRFLVTDVVAVGDLVTLATGLVTLLVKGEPLGRDHPRTREGSSTELRGRKKM